VQKVAADTGAPLTAAREVADEPVAVVVKALPACRLLDELADLLDYRWRREGKEGESRYEIYQDVAARQREEALRQARLAEVEQRFQDEVARYGDLSRLTQKEIQALLDSWPPRPSEQRGAQGVSSDHVERVQRWNLAHRLTSPLSRTLADVVCHLSPQQWARLRSEQQLIFSSVPQPGELPLPTATTDRFRTAPPSARAFLEHVKSLNPEDFESLRTEVQAMEDQWKETPGYRMVVNLSTDRLPLNGQLILNAQVQPLPSPGVPQAGISTGDTYFNIESTFAEQAQRMADDEFPSRHAAWVADPVFGAKKRFSPEIKPRPNIVGPASGLSGWTFRDLLPDLARIYNVQFVADAYGGSPTITLPELTSSGAQALWEILNCFLWPGYQWDRHDNLVRIRERDWFRARPREIPLRLVRRWNELYDRNGALPLEEYLGIVTSLNEAQIENLDNLSRAPGTAAVPPDFSGIYRARRPLRLYAALSPAQRQTAWQGRPVPATQMTAAQRDLFLTALRAYSRDSRSPFNIEEALQGSFSLSTSRLIRVRARDGERITQEDEPASLSSAVAASPSAPGSSPASGPPPGTVPRYPVTQLYFQFHLGQEAHGVQGITIASPP
jgi:hypothetical protein